MTYYNYLFLYSFYAICFIYFLFVLNLYYEVFPSRDKKASTMSIFSEATKMKPSSLSNDTIKLIVVSRVHMKSATTMPDPTHVLDFILRVQEFASHILICVGAENIRDTERYVEAAETLLQSYVKESILLNNIQITFLPIYPWGYFTTPLNAAIQFAQDKGFKYIVFQVSRIRTFFSPL